MGRQRPCLPLDQVFLLSPPLQSNHTNFAVVYFLSFRLCKSLNSCQDELNLVLVNNNMCSSISFNTRILAQLYPIAGSVVRDDFGATILALIYKGICSRSISVWLRHRWSKKSPMKQKVKRLTVSLVSKLESRQVAISNRQPGGFQVASGRSREACL